MHAANGSRVRDEGDSNLQSATYTLVQFCHPFQGL